MRNQILDEEEVLRYNDEVRPSFWSDFKYFIGALLFGMGMVYLFMSLFYFQISSSMTMMLEGSNYEEIFRDYAKDETMIGFPFLFILILVLVWFINRKVSGAKILKYVYSLLGMVLIYLLFVSDFLDGVLLTNGSGLLLGLGMVCLSVFLMVRKEG